MREKESSIIKQKVSNNVSTVPLWVAESGWWQVEHFWVPFVDIHGIFLQEAYFTAGCGSVEEMLSLPLGTLWLLILAFRQIPVVSQGPRVWEQDSCRDSDCLWLWHTLWHMLSAVVSCSFSVERNDLQSSANWWWWWTWWWQRLRWDSSL